jgi:Zn-dependent protease
MDMGILYSGLIQYLFFIPIVTFHEWAHAWTAWKCGDDTAFREGRVSLNPAVHMEVMGTVILPLLAVVLSASGSGLAGLIIGWGRPVPVDISQLRHRRRDDTLVSLAGPVMNVLLAVVLMVVARGGQLANIEVFTKYAVDAAELSLFLCFFNLIPVPPLDGSHVVKNLIGMSYETYASLCQFGFFLVIVVVQIRPVMQAVYSATVGTLIFFANLLGLQ